MRKFLYAFVAFVLIGAGSASAAEVAPGFGASLRLAYGLPMGQTVDAAGADLSNAFSGSLPVQIDLGYRFSPAFAAAAYFQYALGFVKEGIDSGSDMRTGVEVFWHFMPGQKFDLWAGLGFGYEWTKAKTVAGLESTLKGFDANLQLGGDFALSPGFGIGPFVQLTAGQYGSIDSGGASVDINDKAFHEWLQFGVRGTFNL